MRLPVWVWLALSSFLVSAAEGATRPRYGGTLTMQLSSPCAEVSACDTLLPLVAETLVRINQQGEFAPSLAVAWQHDADRKRWRFSLRPKVVFHDGEELNAAAAVPALNTSLKKIHPDVALTAGGQTLVIQSPSPMPDLLAELSRPRSAIFRTDAKGLLIGTGPFRVTAWEPSRRITLAAFDEYWAGRPFLDSVIGNFGAARALGDVFDIPFSELRRIVPERTRIWSSPPRELIALVADRVAPEMWQALALAIDRAPIANVLAQKRAEAAYGLLPQWLTGYEFLFAAPPDLARAKQLVVPLHSTPLALGYPADDAFARSVAERIAVNARDAGIVLQPTRNPGANIRLIRWPLESTDAASELVRFAEMLGLPEHATNLDSARPETIYQAERALLEAHRILPIAYLPDIYGIAPRVHNWAEAHKNGFTLHLDNVWVDP